jgi:CubicO group peptidase (beta-lactamase class C family)
MSEAENIIPLSSAKPLGFSEERLNKIPAFFQSYIDKKKLAGYSALVARGDEVAHFASGGTLALDNKTAISADTIFRIFSMSKPITSVALMGLFEQGAFRLDNPVEKFLPEFADMKVWQGGTNLRPSVRPALRPMTIHHLLTHCSGLTYDFMQNHPIDRFYRHRKIGANAMNLKDTVKAACLLPLLFDPGDKWNYSISTDVCGRLIEVMSGQSLDAYLKKYIFDPLKMDDTGFYVPQDKLQRFASLYHKDPKAAQLAEVPKGGVAIPFDEPPLYLSGGGGLTSTIKDYLRFCQMLLNEGELEGARILSPNTIRFMTDNHLPNRATLDQISISTFSENRFDGTGFGLGFSVITDPAAVQMPVSPGTYSWGGAASTFFWIDPEEDLIGLFMTQFMPSDHYPLRAQLQQLTYAALI